VSDDQKTWASAIESPCLGILGPWRLDECRECELCAGCATHECYAEEASAVLHMDWFRDFASPGEPECGAMGGPASQVPAPYAPRPCQLPAGHKGSKHRARMGWAWGKAECR
jgi:hypothetical protein